MLEETSSQVIVKSGLYRSFDSILPEITVPQTHMGQAIIQVSEVDQTSSEIGSGRGLWPTRELVHI